MSYLAKTGLVMFNFFSVLLSPVLDGFDQPINYYCTVHFLSSALSINTATSEIFFTVKISGAAIRTRAAGREASMLSTVLCDPLVFTILWRTLSDLHDSICIHGKEILYTQNGYIQIARIGLLNGKQLPLAP